MVKYITSQQKDELDEARANDMQEYHRSPIDCKVTHWMLLPTVPRMGDDNG